MTAREIKKNIYAVGALDYDRKLFDELIPLPDGTTYNSYLIKGSKKTALIDTVDPTKTEVLIENLKSLKLERIDYIIANHAEQDHSGSIPHVLEKHPEAKVVTNAKCKDMLIDLLDISPEKFVVISDREKLSLGDKTLEFIFTPWVHWPETMFTYLAEDGVLFTCDFLGSHLAADDLYVKDKQRVYEAAKRYYAEIMMPFRNNIKKHLETISTLKFDMVGTSHGPVYADDSVAWITDAYKDWISDNVKNEVLIPYVSMHDSTRRAVDFLADELTNKKIAVKTFNLTKTDLGSLAIALVDAATIIIATPTVLAGPHPAVAYAASLIGALRPKTKFMGYVISFGWAGKAMEHLDQFFSNLKTEKLETVSIKGLPKKSDYANLTKLADEIAERHKSL